MNKNNTLSSIRKLTKDAKRRRVNRVYYKHDFNPKPLTELGVLRTKEKNALDLVALSSTLNEQISYYGINKLGTYFELNINITSLYADVQKPHRESLLRHGQVRFVYEDKLNGWRYEYEHEDLLDYQKKRTASDYESIHVYKIGSISIDVSIPFALSRISFNGMIKRRQINQADAAPTVPTPELISARIGISTHPTCDKFDYTYSFSSKFLAETIQKSTTHANEAQRLMALALEDRIEQTFMYRCELELLGLNTKTRDILWGAKSRRFVDPRAELANKSIGQPLESLLIWSELGTMIHLRRPVGRPSLVYGLAHCGFDYLSHLYSASCMVPDSAIETDFGRLASFSSIPANTKMSVTVFKRKTLEIITTQAVADNQPFPVTIDGVSGWAFCRCDNPGELIKDVQSKLLYALNIHDRHLTYRLSSEALLGGKGNSLVGLSFLTSDCNQSGVDMRNLLDPSGELQCKGVSVPRGVVVSSLAYQMWLESNPVIGATIRELDNTRRALAARSFYVNPLDDKHLTISQHQQALRDQCHKTNLLLNSCSLPAPVERQLYARLRRIFSESELMDHNQQSLDGAGPRRKLFAVRSSAMGEDAVETSAAGQMRTILDAQGFESICRAIVACWASQFELEAVTYKTQNSLLFNWPMAVVVQELIECDVAGVAATCNPLDGRASQLEITANLGLGEGVVAGKKTDTVKVQLDSQLKWDSQAETYVDQLNLATLPPNCVQKITGNTDDEASECCLTDKQIVALSNLLIWLRGRYQKKEREIEWGITRAGDSGSFNIHLLQSRPLTNLGKPNNAIIAHELDTGVLSPVDVITRANLGEVMPGCVSPLFVTHFLAPTVALDMDKPVDKNHTVEYFSSSTFNTSAQIVSLSITGCYSINRMLSVDPHHIKTIQMMVGYELNEDYSNEIIELFSRIRFHPLFKQRQHFLHVLATDLGYIEANNLLITRALNGTSFMHKLTSIDDLISHMDTSDLIKRSSTSSTKPLLPASSGVVDKIPQDNGNTQEQSSCYTSLALNHEQYGDEMTKLVRNHTLTIYKRLIEQIDLIDKAWKQHMRATVSSMAFNTLCIHLMNQQEFYKSIENEQERITTIMNDFSVLIRDSNKDKTESGDISVFLDRIVNHLASEGKLPEARRMTTQELYTNLNDPNNRADSAVKFRYFLARNGHRAFKEFDYANLTWADDPSYVIKSLSVRLKQHTLATPTINCKQNRGKSSSEKASDVEKIHSRITAKRAVLIKYAIPRAQKAVARRENTKSTLIKTVDLYRKGFRALGALLCLEGRLSDVNLIYYFSLDELNTLILASDQRRIDLARLVFKARRRQQVLRSIEGLSFPDMTINVIKAYDVIDRALDGKTSANAANNNQADHVEDESIKSSCIVRGMTSCNGIVTGRACVVNSLDEIDLVQPNDILITYSIDVSWTVYFFTIAGIVTEVGGIVSHGAVVAREYGIPTLCMAAGSCSKFKTGQMITLDANKAVCYLAEDNIDDVTDCKNDEVVSAGDAGEETISKIEPTLDVVQVE